MLIVQVWTALYHFLCYLKVRFRTLLEINILQKLMHVFGLVLKNCPVRICTGLLVLKFMSCNSTNLFNPSKCVF